MKVLNIKQMAAIAVLSDEFELVSGRPVTLSIIPRKVRATRQERRCVSA